jgi:hypothetical protein
VLGNVVAVTVSVYLFGGLTLKEPVTTGDPAPGPASGGTTASGLPPTVSNAADTVSMPNSADDAYEILNVIVVDVPVVREKDAVVPQAPLVPSTVPEIMDVPVSVTGHHVPKVFL